MAKTKLALSRPRKSKKLIMKKLSEKRWKTLAQSNLVQNNDATSERTSETSYTDMSYSSSPVQRTRSFSLSDADSLDHTDPKLCENMVLNEYLGVDEDYVEQQRFDAMSECRNTENEVDSSSNSEEDESSYLEELLCVPDETANEILTLKGRRIVNISYFFNQLKSLRHKGFDCSFFNMDLVSEEIDGLHSIFTFKCASCNILQTIKSEDSSDSINSNVSAILGTVSCGIGYSQLPELFTAMEIPNMSDKTYSKYHDRIASVVDHEVEDVMKQTGEEEARLAKQGGGVSADGIPIIIRNTENEVDSSSNSEEDEFSDLEELLCVPDETAKEIFTLKGRRIVNISYFFNQLKSLRHKGFDCSFFNIDLVSEKIDGLHSIFTFKCAVCNILQTIKSEDSSDSINSNMSAILGTVSCGIGYSQLSELFAAMDIPNMSNKTYSKYHDRIASVVDHQVEDIMKQAGEEEARLAKQCGDVSADRIPIISVIVDGAWSKRSYRTNYNALSGVGCIIGAKTKKILYMGVRNKYCYVCERLNTVKDHNCYKNWNSSSTSMEADIIVTGFMKSVETHNLIYGKVIGDGDSSVHRKLIESAPYGPMFVIEKIECRNHILRNYLSRIADLSKDSKFPIDLRKKITSSDTLGRFRSAVTKAIAYRQKEQGSFSIRANSLKADIKNGPNHLFGDHEACDDYFCKKTREEVNLVPRLKACGLFNVINALNQRLADNAISLLYDVDTNAAENYNSIVAKFVGGKRINYSLKGSYEMRCRAAAISYNSDGDFLRIVSESLHCTSTDTSYLEKFQERKRKARESRRKRKCIKRKAISKTDENYGPDVSSFIPDLEQNLYQEKAQKFLHDLQVADKQNIFQNTLLQSKSNLWQTERKKRITASSFGRICKLRKTTSTNKMVCALLYSNFSGSIATRFGLENEEVAISLFEKKFGKSVQRSGLIIDNEIPYLACSPDGLIGDDALIEIKSSHKSGSLTPLQAVIQRRIDYCTLTNGQLYLKRTHNYYYQIQGLLHITNRNLCYFIVYTKGGLHVEEINRDDVFWDENMKDKLCQFFTYSLLPELVDSRRHRQQEIRHAYLK